MKIYRLLYALTAAFIMAPAVIMGAGAGVSTAIEQPAGRFSCLGDPNAGYLLLSQNIIMKGKVPPKKVLIKNLTETSPTLGHEGQCMPLISWAVAFNDKPVVRFFLETLSKNLSKEKVRACINRTDISNAKHLDGMSALHLAVINGCYATVELLLKYGADVSAKNQNGESPFWLAITHAIHIPNPTQRLDLIKLLYNHGTEHPSLFETNKAGLKLYMAGIYGDRQHPHPQVIQWIKDHLPSDTDITMPKAVIPAHIQNILLRYALAALHSEEEKKSDEAKAAQAQEEHVEAPAKMAHGAGNPADAITPDPVIPREEHKVERKKDEGDSAGAGANAESPGPTPRHAGLFSTQTSAAATAATHATLPISGAPSGSPRVEGEAGAGTVAGTDAGAGAASKKPPTGAAARYLQLDDTSKAILTGANGVPLLSVAVWSCDLELLEHLLKHANPQSISVALLQKTKPESIKYTRSKEYIGLTSLGIATLRLSKEQCEEQKQILQEMINILNYYSDKEKKEAEAKATEEKKAAAEKAARELVKQEEAEALAKKARDDLKKEKAKRKQQALKEVKEAETAKAQRLADAQQREAERKQQQEAAQAKLEKERKEAETKAQEATEKAAQQNAEKVARDKAKKQQKKDAKRAAEEAKKEVEAKATEKQEPEAEMAATHQAQKEHVEAPAKMVHGAGNPADAIRPNPVMPREEHKVERKKDEDDSADAGANAESPGTPTPIHTRSVYLVEPTPVARVASSRDKVAGGVGARAGAGEGAGARSPETPTPRHAGLFSTQTPVAAAAAVAATRVTLPMAGAPSRSPRAEGEAGADIVGEDPGASLVGDPLTLIENFFSKHENIDQKLLQTRLMRNDRGEGQALPADFHLLELAELYLLVDGYIPRELLDALQQHTPGPGSMSRQEAAVREIIKLEKEALHKSDYLLALKVKDPFALLKYCQINSETPCDLIYEKAKRYLTLQLQRGEAPAISASKPAPKNSYARGIAQWLQCILAAACKKP